MSNTRQFAAAASQWRATYEPGDQERDNAGTLMFNSDGTPTLKPWKMIDIIGWEYDPETRKVEAFVADGNTASRASSIPGLKGYQDFS